MAEIIADSQTKNLSKSGTTGVIIAATGGFDLAQNAIIPLISGGTSSINWVSIVAMVGGILVALFRKYSDGKIPKVV